VTTDRKQLRLADASIADLVHELLEKLDEKPERDGLRRTPERVEKSLKWLTRGYHLSVEDAIGNAIFAEDHSSMMLPFFGKVHVAYIPNGRIVGLSKLARVVEIFARRLQVQERMTEQIAEALCSVLKPQGVGVVCEAFHLCMMMRGVEKQNSKTITSSMQGVFLDDIKTREEFLRLIH
jgi:GTP cyclohydrolase I